MIATRPSLSERELARQVRLLRALLRKHPMIRGPGSGGLTRALRTRSPSSIVNAISLISFKATGNPAAEAEARNLCRLCDELNQEYYRNPRLEVPPELTRARSVWPEVLPRRGAPLGSGPRPWLGELTSRLKNQFKSRFQNRTQS